MSDPQRRTTTGNSSPHLHFPTPAARGCKAAVVVVGAVVTLLSGVGARLAEAARPSGVIQGRVFQVFGVDPATRVFVENIQSGFVAVAPVSAAEDSYSANVPVGDYQVYAWLPDFSKMGAHASRASGPGLGDYELRTVSVATGEVVEGVDLDVWFTPAEELLVLGGRLIDGTGAAPVDDAVVVIWDGHVMAAGPASEMPVIAAEPRAGSSSWTLLPGFINAHVHNAYDEENLRRWAFEGVTTVRDLGAPVNLQWDALRARFAGDARCARVLASGPLVTCEGGYPIAGNGFPSLTISSGTEARREINALVDRGADVIKIVIESGVGNLLSRELATAIVDAAHFRGVPVTVHLTRLQDLRTALDAGVDDIAHMVVDHVPSSVIQRMVSDGVGWVPTMMAVGGPRAVTESNLMRFVAAGGVAAMGNDSGYLTGLVIGMPVPELLRMERAGLRPMEVIVSATSAAAAVCRVDALLGTIEAGKVADLVVVRGDPLLDLEALRSVQMVIHGGEVIRDHSELPRRPRGRRRLTSTTAPPALRPMSSSLLRRPPISPSSVR